MRIEPLPEPSIVQAFFCAPLITPFLAFPLAALHPAIYGNVFSLLLALPFVVVISLILGYLGQALICFPIFLLLKRINKLNAVRLCSYTTAFGAGLFTCLFGHEREFSNFANLVGHFTIGAGCSFGVCAFFCLLADITLTKSL